ncbi:MAG: TetR/AcrR family transcriptional regulator C-terminal domain-containing protein [Thermoleophilia bacterium]|nr:TetR/AcrR family transcriptional regulator C-terminal domain-containing protein [Thermoleophilia bacterium]
MSAEPRTPLTRDRVVAAAVGRADAAGLDGLSMRALADELGVVPMALYKHVANKGALLDAMVEALFVEIGVRDASADWRGWLRRRATEVRGALRRHPWANGIMETRAPGPVNLRHHDAVLGCLRGAGFAFADAIHAYSLMDAYVYGFAAQEAALGFARPSDAGEAASRRAASVPSSDGLPHLAELVRLLPASGYDPDVEFAWGLDLLLEGLERRLASRR